jgi:hypothetical protein
MRHPVSPINPLRCPLIVNAAVICVVLVTVTLLIVIPLLVVDTVAPDTKLVPDRQPCFAECQVNLQQKGRSSRFIAFSQNWSAAGVGTCRSSTVMPCFLSILVK